MVDEEDLHGVAEGAEQQVDIPDGESGEAPLLHAEEVEPRHGHHHGHPHRPGGLPPQEDTQNGHDDDVEGGEEARLSGGDGLDAQLLEVRPQAHGGAAAEAA